MKTNKNKELQSRREFFKSAAKAALPVIGAMLMMQIPLAAKATPKTGCETCTGGCSYTCQYTCKGACMNSCPGNCEGTCKNGCVHRTNA